MSNMSYCRFENTLQDLYACQQHLFDTLSNDEHKARIKLLKLCKAIAETNPEDVEDFIDTNDDVEEDEDDLEEEEQ